MMNFSYWCRYHRIRLGMSRRAVAEAVGVSLRTIESWENGERFPSQQHLEMVCGLYGVDLPWKAAR